METLLKNVEKHPESSQALSDLQTVKPFLRLLDVLAAEEKQGYHSEEAKRMHTSCVELWSKASEAIRLINIDFELEELLQISEG